MSDNGNAGYATMQVIPSFRGMTTMMNRELAGIMPGVGRQAGASMGAGLTSGFGRALKIAGPIAVAGAAFLKTLNIARDFEAQISGIAAVSGATGSQLDQLRQKALQLGADTAFSASESAGAMEELVKAGVSVEGVLGGAADAAVALAAAGGVELATAAEIAANAMNQFGLAAKDMPQIADLVAAAANNSAISVEDFAYSMQMSGAVANLVGLDFEDTAAAITAMGNAGIAGSDAGTSLKTMLMRLEPTTDRAATLMGELGIITGDGANQFFTAAGEVRSMAEISGVLTKALEGQTRQQQLANLNVLFGSDAIRAAAVLYDEGAAGIDKITEANRKLTAEEIASARLDNLNGSIEQLSGSAETLAIKVGTLAIPAARAMVDVMNEAVDFLASPPEGFFDPLIDGGRDLVDTGENVIEILHDLVSAGRPVAEFGAKLGAAGAVTGLKVMADVLERTTDLLADHSEVVALAAGAWVGLKVAAVAGSAWTALSGQVMAARSSVLYLTGSVQGLAATRGVSTLTASMGVLRSSIVTTTTAAGALRFATMGAVGGAFLIGDAWSKSKQQAQQAIDDIKSKTDELSPESMRTTANALRDQATAAAEAAEGQGGLGGALRGTLELMTPMKNTTLDNIGALDQLSSATKAADAAYYGLISRYNEVYALMNGMSGIELVEQGSVDRVERWVRLLESQGIDTAVLSTGDLANQIIAVRDAGSNATPVTESLAGAMRVFGDETATAKDQLDAWKDLVDSIFGVEQSVFDATTKWGDALQSLTADLKENAWGGIDEMTEAGRNNRAALSDAAGAAMDLAEAYLAAGRTDEAAWMLANTRNELIEAGRAAGIAEEDMESYLATLGLTPRQIDTIIKAAIDPTGLAAAETDLNQLARTRTARIEAFYSDPATRHFGDYYERRWGGLESYRNGGLPQAQYANRTMYQWAEPATGGEMFVPKNGRPGRSVPHLRTAAGWYGYDLVPRRATPMALGGLSGGSGSAATPSGGASGPAIEFSGDIKLETKDPKRHALDLFRHMDAELWLHPSGGGG